MAQPTLSFEFFPPRTAAQAPRFWRTLGCLETLSPEFVSVTYGALGSGSQASVDVVAALKKDNALSVAAHLTCAGRSTDAVNASLDEFIAMGVRHIVALRGDKFEESPKRPPEPGEPAHQSAQNPVMHNATELVELIAGRRDVDMDISVAAYPEVHPEAGSAEDDMHWLKTKFDLGASRALTQLFYDPDVFLRWRDRAVQYGIDKPLVPGILPVHNIDKVIDFGARCGSSVPTALVERFRQATDAQSSRELAIEHCVELCQQLQGEGIDAFHLYTLNQSTLSFAVSQELLGHNAQRQAA